MPAAIVAGISFGKYIVDSPVPLFKFSHLVSTPSASEGINGHAKREPPAFDPLAAARGTNQMTVRSQRLTAAKEWETPATDLIRINSHE